MSLFGRSVLFVSSYAPLLLLFALLDSFGAIGSRICLVVCAVSVAALGMLWYTLRSRLQPEQVRIEGARSRDADVMAYVVSYVVPFAAATDATDHRTRSALAVFAALIAILYIRSAVYFVHPLLLLAGVHVYEASRDGVPMVVLTRQTHLRQSCNLQVVNIGPNVYVEKAS